jgi:very-short-patch-repair endonuclease
MTVRRALSLDRQVAAIGLPVPEMEVRFHPVRKWRADYLWRAPHMLICEVDGGVFVTGRHSRGAGVEKDCEKFAEAMVLGYRVLRVTTRHVRNGLALGWIEKLLRAGR